MRRTIFITVAEFLENGGDIMKKKHIYTSAGTYLGDVKSWNNYIIELTNDRFGDNDAMYVEVNCIPIYD